MARGFRVTEAIDRLVDKFEIDPETGCWNWTGFRMATGYGTFRYGRDVKKAHRAAYELVVEAIPGGLEIDHLCRNRSCVNPDHLEVVTHRENTVRGNSQAGLNARKTHCPKGHPYDDANTKWFDGKRYCRECSNANSMASYYRRRAKCQK